MLLDVERQLFDEPTIMRRLDELSREITAHYRGLDLTILLVLKGSLIFAADLMRRIDLPLKLVCLSASSYHGGTESTGHVIFERTKLPDIAHRHVLVVDDILDTGRTLGSLRDWLVEEAEPLSVEICVLLQKRKVRAVPVEARYAAFEIGDEFVIGYGLDFQERYRNLPFIGTLRQEVAAAALG